MRKNFKKVMDDIINNPARTTFIIAVIFIAIVSVHWYRNDYIIQKGIEQVPFASGQFDSADKYIQVEANLKRTAATAAYFVNSMYDLDKESDNRVFKDKQFDNTLLYGDWVIYGEYYTNININTLENKIYTLNNMIATINSNIDDINVYIYGSNNTKMYEYLYRELNSSIEITNKSIGEYYSSGSEDKKDVPNIRISKIKEIGK